MARLPGQVAAGVNVTGEVSPHFQAGKLKILAVSSKKRAPALPNVPTFTELGYPSGADIAEYRHTVMTRSHAPVRGIADKESA